MLSRVCRGLGAIFVVAAAGMLGVPPAAGDASLVPPIKPRFFEPPGFSEDVLTATDRGIAKRAFDAVEHYRWAEARAIAATASDTLPAKIVDWLYFVQPGSPAHWTEIAAFVKANPGWPRPVALRMRVEEAMSAQSDPELRRAWFAAYPPVTPRGLLFAGEALIGTQKGTRGRSYIRTAWIEGDFSSREERRIRHEHGRFLGDDDHQARLDRLLWEGKRTGAYRMEKHVGEDWQLLSKARRTLRYDGPGVDAAVARVPEGLKNHPGLVYERVRWRRRHGLTDTAIELLLAQPADISGGTHAGRWWVERQILARDALEEGRPEIAYRLVSEHRINPENAGDYSEAEWLSGWIALRFLDKPLLAARHFADMDAAVSYPISRARASYWAGRAAEAGGEEATAGAWYSRAAAHTATYYGQLAAERLKAPVGATTSSSVEVEPEARRAFMGSELARATRLIEEMGRRRSVRYFILAMNDAAQAPEDYANIAELANRIGRRDMALFTAKRAVLSGISLPRYNYPTIEAPVELLSPSDAEVALVYALSRQESGFDHAAISHAGARGLMQLMPTTARLVARSIKVSYRTQWLTEDPVYNMMLGVAHLNDLLERYDGSYVMALAAYNAGEGRVSSWRRRFGDPRDPDVDVIDWIEQIPIYETRNYVQRVLENVQVYRSILGGETEPSLLADLHRGRPAPRAARNDAAGDARARGT